VRPSAHAGRFYPAEAEKLRGDVNGLLEESGRSAYRRAPLGLLAPHAGYVYSGQVAAAAYGTVRGLTYDRVVILAPTHTARFRGAALCSHDAFATPLGAVPLDREAVDALAREPGFAIDDAAHADEHAIEVELPFLQVALAGPFRIVPISLGESTPAGLVSVAESLIRLVEERRARCQRWLVVASSDTYHGHDREACRTNDEKLMALLSAMDFEGLMKDSASREVMACGWKGLAVTMMLAKRFGAREGLLLKHRDSCDALGDAAAGEAERYVVGYVGAAFQ
jgi:hypothetical protein